MGVVPPTRTRRARRQPTVLRPTAPPHWCARQRSDRRADCMPPAERWTGGSTMGGRQRTQMRGCCFTFVHGRLGARLRLFIVQQTVVGCSPARRPLRCRAHQWVAPWDDAAAADAARASYGLVGPPPSALDPATASFVRSCRLSAARADDFAIREVAIELHSKSHAKARRSTPRGITFRAKGSL